MINIRYGMIFVSVGLLISLIQLLYIKILQDSCVFCAFIIALYFNYVKKIQKKKK